MCKSKKEIVEKGKELREENKKLLDKLTDNYTISQKNKDDYKKNTISREEYKENRKEILDNIQSIQQEITNNTALIVGIESTI